MTLSDLTPMFIAFIASLTGIVLGETITHAWEKGKLQRRYALIKVKVNRLKRRLHL